MTQEDLDHVRAIGIRYEWGGVRITEGEWVKLLLRGQWKDPDPGAVALAEAIVREGRARRCEKVAAAYRDAERWVSELLRSEASPP